MTISSHTADDARFLGPGEGEAIWFLRNRMTVKATEASTGGGFGLLESLIAPGFSPPLHVHRREDESFYVLEGELTMKCGDRTFRAAAGSFVFLPRNVPHTFVVEGDKPARMLTLLTPGGGEGVFIDAGRPAEAEGLPPASPPDIEALKRVSARYEAEIVGPPMAPTAQPPASHATA
ncbi:cupin domain-containing protein [Mesorhizobium sp. M2D.F.Ca.ET.185.01.1.1]|uniref:quercetin 2,3-dioxygenase n=1 Tax=unclassified Mesorhizobium TaxID=325217 RepID=UPI000FCBCA0A|nr:MULTISPECIES: quercetin 2,3-dioxygenase [unclassified Mesorhizobium]TGP78960.1 cupin domain-containing protein [bacterium M00.F.Ca.ET.227.01.1.1]TGP89511.1 cupin domain-containing protein [bacterium M00.F.Ca.ET.221.01.1.1]TGP94879.1 cupin domain-containing protein [bacterium M00.F.Ca.ET.222.01.1.1]TGT71188.1 cupin domain-containing protein [bacterium M00.F.Ca.ET.159.01.1.1]TGT83031.1 cupin domain-containing protein [bacterium M00.F.Ca.ET.157.01.1.1]TGU02733.1 cupin domain-containing protei